ncbi:baseplate protein [Vibrio phage 5P1c]
MDVLPNVNRVVYDMSFVQDAFNLLPYEQQTKENLVKMLIVFSERWNKVQNEAITLAYSRFVDNASGEMLTGLASRFFIERGGQDDQSLRGAIKLRALRQDNEGTRDQIVNILQIISGSNSVEVFKGPNKYVEVVFPAECLSLKDIRVEIEDLFPTDTNLVVGDVITGQPPLGMYSVGDTEVEKGLGVLGSTSDPSSVKSNNVPVLVISTETL